VKRFFAEAVGDGLFVAHGAFLGEKVTATMRLTIPPFRRTASGEGEMVVGWLGGWVARWSFSTT
jgi:hypothetical protein